MSNSKTEIFRIVFWPFKTDFTYSIYSLFYLLTTCGILLVPNTVYLQRLKQKRCNLCKATELVGWHSQYLYHLYSCLTFVLNFSTLHCSNIFCVCVFFKFFVDKTFLKLTTGREMQMYIYTHLCNCLVVAFCGFIAVVFCNCGENCEKPVLI